MRLFHDDLACFTEHSELQEAASDRQIDCAANQNERNEPWLVQDVTNC